MRVRFAVLGVLAVMCVSAASATAVTLPSVCPSGYHDSGPIHLSGAVVPGVPENSNGFCVSDGQRLAPSGSGMIPTSSVAKDSRMRSRVEVALGGALVGIALLLLGTWRRPRRVDAPSTESVPIA